jgi:ribosome-associated heat shock protein Hsp15
MERPRIDTWLKLVCLFKHRADATEACKGGKVKINGNRVKPAAAVKEGRHRVLRRRPAAASSSEADSGDERLEEIARTMYVDETPARERSTS